MACFCVVADVKEFYAKPSQALALWNQGLSGKLCSKSLPSCWDNGKLGTMIESVQQGLGVAAAVVRRDVVQAVGRHDSILADTTNPVVACVVIALGIEEFEPPVAVDDVIDLSDDIVRVGIYIHHNLEYLKGQVTYSMTA